MLPLVVIILSILSGWLYRAGGIGKPYPTKLRDIGCSLCLIASLYLFKGLQWAYLPVFALSWGALASYWKGKAVDMKWWNWGLHGLGCGLAALPVIFLGISWYQIGLRTLFCTVAMTAISEASKDVFVEEFGRGFIFCASVIFLI
jgi:hypothetical protein